jgi:hypothetical protein
VQEWLPTENRTRKPAIKMECFISFYVYLSVKEENKNFFTHRNRFTKA